MPQHRKWTILALVLIAECMDLLDGTIVNVAAPTIHNDLHSSATGLQWILSGYALAFAMVLITGGRLGDIYGRRRLFIIGSLGFVAASVACGLASTPEMLIACRLAQGSAAALLVPQGLGIIHTVFSSEEQGSAFALFGPVIGLSAMLGPIIGGTLIAANLFGSGWRLVFFVNLPLGLIAAIGAAVLMPESRSPRRLRLDAGGGLLAALGMGLLVYPLTEGQSHDWPAWTYLMLVASAASFAGLVWWNRRVHRAGGDPLVEPSIFEQRAYVAGLASIVVLFAGLLGTMLVMTLFLQFGEHFTPIHAGLTLAPFALGSAIGATLAAALIAPRLGRRVLQLGAVIVAVAVLWLRHVVTSRGLHVTTGALIGPELVLGIGIGMGISPLFDFILASVREHQVGSASGVLNAVQQLAGAIGVAVIGTIFFTVLGHSGYVVALSRCLLVEVATMPVLIALVQLLPRHAREPDATVPRVDEAATTHTFVQMADLR
jgi:EmrB/QacA subfamily drug resistance transporter